MSGERTIKSVLEIRSIQHCSNIVLMYCAWRDKGLAFYKDSILIDAVLFMLDWREHIHLPDSDVSISILLVSYLAV